MEQVAESNFLGVDLINGFYQVLLMDVYVRRD